MDENQIINCQIEIYQNEGFDLLRTIIDYENALIQNGVLLDKTGESYISLLNRIITDDNYQIDSLISFYEVDPFFKISESARTKLGNCAIKQDLKNSSSKWVIIDEKIKTIKFGESNPAKKMSEILLETLDEDDFIMAYYKLKTFLTIEMVNLKYGSRKLLPPIISDEN